MLSEKKVTDSEIASGVVSLPDKPSEEGIGAEDLKARFDLFPKMIANKFNALIDELLSSGLKELGGLNEAEITALINQSKEELAQSLAEHSENKENPHEVTAMQLGVDTAAVVQYKINQAKAEVQGSLNTHVEDKGNPHNVTAEQIGSLGEERIANTLNDVDQTKIPTLKAVNEGISFAGGGDMMKSVYDPLGKARDIFAYTDEARSAAENAAATLANTAKTSANQYTDEKFKNVPSKTSELENDSDFATNASLDELETELKNSVSDGKTRVANAITAKGVTTATNATFTTMATNIGKIETGTLSKSTATTESLSTNKHYGETGYQLLCSKTISKPFKAIRFTAKHKASDGSQPRDYSDIFLPFYKLKIKDYRHENDKNYFVIESFVPTDKTLVDDIYLWYENDEGATSGSTNITYIQFSADYKTVYFYAKLTDGQNNDHGTTTTFDLEYYY